MENHGIVLFDGVCNLCNGTVQFIIQRDATAHFKFAAIQSERGMALMAAHDLEPGDLASVVLIEDGRCFARSDAALAIAKGLSGPWPWMAVFWWVPRFIRDGVYNVIARNRYTWFGKRDVCMVPSQDLLARFLS
jgi:predicted DCC family thiol-disulfide oxidoreductase YuxK